jgi:hypothetical protein
MCSELLQAVHQPQRAVFGVFGARFWFDKIFCVVNAERNTVFAAGYGASQRRNEAFEI